MRWSNQGACLRTARLEEYPQKRGLPQGVLLLDAPKDGPATLALIDPKGELPLDGQVYKVVEDSEQRLAFAATFPNGLRVTKAFRPDPVKKYDLLANVTLENTGTQPLEAQYEIVAVSRLVPEAGWSTEVQAALGSRYETGRVKIDLVSPSKVSKAPFEATNNERQPLVWAGAGNRYFAAVLTPAPKRARLDLRLYSLRFRLEPAEMRCNRELLRFRQLGGQRGGQAPDGPAHPQTGRNASRTITPIFSARRSRTCSSNIPTCPAC